ncbi:MAG TPA: ribose-5-phosphate isomerase RpiA [Chloroflexota bacterium]|nr:ribose-5-phosphate isomerase RpiA [Chloroflexota bacterium]
MTDEAESLKRAAAREAVTLVEDGMIVGLGSGTTSELFLEALAERVAGGLRITAVPTSERVASMAHARGLRVAELHDVPGIDLTVDGADEIQPRGLDLIKGGGGALLREKLVAAAADRLCIIADRSKLVSRLGERWAVPVVVVPFGWRQTADRIRALGGQPSLRHVDGSPLVTDDGLHILDCRFGPIADPAKLAGALKGLLGVVEHGLFVGLAKQAIVAGEDGIEILRAEGVVA